MLRRDTGLGFIMVQRLATKKVSKAETKRIIERHRSAVRKWYDENKEYFKEYYYTHRKQIKENYDNYRKSRKGIEAINRYETKPARRKAKTEWMRNFREQQKKEKRHGKKR